jgi:hypothetical protein
MIKYLRAPRKSNQKPKSEKNNTYGNEGFVLFFVRSFVPFIFIIITKIEHGSRKKKSAECTGYICDTRRKKEYSITTEQQKKKQLCTTFMK